MSLLIRAALALAVALSGFVGWGAIASHYIDQGRAEVQQRWDKAVLQQERDHGKAIAQQTEKERATEQAAQKAAEQSLQEAARRDAARDRRVADLRRAADGLRRELAAADAAHAAYRAARPDAAAGAALDATAARARELFGACAGRYASVAASAAGLASQVMGLQDHLIIVQPEAAALLEPAP